MPSIIEAQSSQGNFALQVSPSPLVSDIKPGSTKTLVLQIKNNSNQTENLKIETRSFTQEGNSNQVKLNDNAPTDIKGWVNFKDPVFTVKQGQWFSEQIIINTPKDAGFSYSFAILISRQSEPKPTTGTQAIRGSVAVFTLLNVNRPDAKRELQVTNFSSIKRVYEYLPASFNVTIRNTGNTIIQPYGNIFIQRKNDSKSPISVLPLNEAKGYILPSTTRTLVTDWAQGFPTYTNYKSAANSPTKKRLQWNWDQLKNLRIGRYSAVLVGAYNDGQRDVPIQATLTFWVIPWRLIIIAVVLISVLAIGFYTIIKKGYQIVPKRKKHAKYSSENH